MEHSKAIEWIWQKIDGELSEADENALQAHLDSCEDCRKLAEFYQQLDTSVASLEEEPPERMAQGIMYQIAPDYVAKKTGKRVRNYRFFGTALGAIAAAFVLLIGTGKLSPAPKMKEVPLVRTEEASMPVLSGAFQEFEESVAIERIVYYTEVEMDENPTQTIEISDLIEFLHDRGLEIPDIVGFNGDPDAAYTADFYPVTEKLSQQYEFLAAGECCVVLKENGR